MGFRSWLEGRLYYHGTPHDFKVFKAASDDVQDGGIWFSDSEAIARGYGCARSGRYNERPTIIVAHIRITKPFIQRDRSVKITNAVINDLKRQGYDGVVRILDGEREFCVFDPSQTREVERRQESYEDFKKRSGVNK